MSYLMIENKGESPVEGFTILGVTTTRFNGTENTIGQFGSGAKYAINLLMRMAMYPIVACGADKLTFGSRPQVINDGLTSREYNRATVKIQVNGMGRGTDHDLGFVLEHGTQDWNDVKMALREFVANAIDRTLRNGDTIKDVNICKVSKVSTQAGFTRVFIPWTLELGNWLSNIDEYFLHFSDMEIPIQKLGVINKVDKSAVKFYKQGVLVRNDAMCSLFDYNFDHRFKLDESRNADSWECSWKAASMLTGLAAKPFIKKLLTAIVNNDQCYELTLQYVNSGNGSSVASLSAWKEAFCEQYGSDAAIYAIEGIDGHLIHQGLKPVFIANHDWYKFFRLCDIQCAEKVLTRESLEVPGVKPATEVQIAALNRVWNDLESLGLTNNKEKPLIKQFSPIMKPNAEQMFGLSKGNVVYVHETIGGQMLYKVLLEEVAHWVTGADDMSRAIQDYLFLALTKIMY